MSGSEVLMCALGHATRTEIASRRGAGEARSGGARVTPAALSARHAVCGGATIESALMEKRAGLALLRCVGDNRCAERSLDPNAAAGGLSSSGFVVLARPCRSAPTPLLRVLIIPPPSLPNPHYLTRSPHAHSSHNTSHTQHLQPSPSPTNDGDHQRPALLAWTLVSHGQSLLRRPHRLSQPCANSTHEQRNSTSATSTYCCACSSSRCSCISGHQRLGTSARFDARSSLREYMRGYAQRCFFPPSC